MVMVLRLMEQGSWECRTRQIGRGRCMSNFWTRQDVKVGESPRRDFSRFLDRMLRLVESINTKEATMLFLYDERTRCSSSRWSLLRIHLVVRLEAGQHSYHWKQLGFRLCLTLQVEPTPTFGVSLVAPVEMYDFVKLWPSSRCGWTHTTRKHQSVSSILRL